jgi:hypothetical protein
VGAYDKSDLDSKKAEVLVLPGPGCFRKTLGHLESLFLRGKCPVPGILGCSDSGAHKKVPRLSLTQCHDPGVVTKCNEKREQMKKSFHLLYFFSNLLNRAL